MAVNSPIPVPSDLKAVAGIELGHAEAGVRKANRKDVLVMKLAETATVAGVFTKNRFCAAPVQICQANLAQLSAGKPIRALVINTGKPAEERRDVLCFTSDPLGEPLLVAGPPRSGKTTALATIALPWPPLSAMPASLSNWLSST